MKLLEEAKKKLTKEEFNAFEQKYYHLIHEWTYYDQSEKIDKLSAVFQN